MPLMTGIGLRIKAQEKLSQCPPFILYSSYSSLLGDAHKKLFHRVILKSGDFEVIHAALKEIEESIMLKSVSLKNKKTLVPVEFETR